MLHGEDKELHSIPWLCSPLPFPKAEDPKASPHCQSMPKATVSPQHIQNYQRDKAQHLKALVIQLTVSSNCNCLGKKFSMPDVCLRLKFSGKFQPNYLDHFQE